MRVPAGCSAFVSTPAFAQIIHFTMRHSSARFLSNDVTRNPYMWLASLLWSALLVGTAYLTVFVLVRPGAASRVLILALGLVPLLISEAARRQEKS
jgi:hypothetical protein